MTHVDLKGTISLSCTSLKTGGERGERERGEEQSNERMALLSSNVLKII
jgi:hypothetical protein